MASEFAVNEPKVAGVIWEAKVRIHDGMKEQASVPNVFWEVWTMTLRMEVGSLHS